MLFSRRTGINAVAAICLSVIAIQARAKDSDVVNFAFAPEGYEPFYFAENSDKKGIFDYLIEATCTRAKLKCVHLYRS